MAITFVDKDRMINHLRSWYKSHSQSADHFEEIGNSRAVEYHKKQMENICWMADTIKNLETEDGGDCPF